MAVSSSLRSTVALLPFFAVAAAARSIGLSLSAWNTTSISIEVASSKIQYTRDAWWLGSSFFDNFDFVTSQEFISNPGLNRSDPTNGFVNYVNETTALTTGLIQFGDYGTPRWGVDTTHNYTLGKDWGRPSIRLESKRSWTHGLFLADIAHMPGAACGVWPAFWTLGSGAWPYNGEIDLIEGANLNADNQITLHTSDNCTMLTPPAAALAPVRDPKNRSRAAYFDLASGECSTNYTTAGCYVNATVPANYGDAFNANGGGIYAMQWTGAFIRTWFFPRGAVPAEVQAAVAGVNDNPDVSAFGLPQAAFVGGRGCNVDQRFKEHRLIFDTTFCGDWAGTQYPSTCPAPAARSKPESCAIYVGANPQAFTEAYWEVNSISVFKELPTYG
ncbi:Glycoside hydrolase family 16 [Macrophomina phaseolina MS6]|uniref:Glycoside hydrolase family 16 n=1 Tax=Macrophomina phaseolina (strain MS6) TaxID=1126212 RepID=K2RWH8_MACPH|nr:Glycoside hydrolase family 16 [Macrophomina phaseolina MS6]